MLGGVDLRPKTVVHQGEIDFYLAAMIGPWGLKLVILRSKM